MNLEETISHWQRRDDNGFVEPWYVHPALDEIKTWELRGKKVFEWGMGLSTLWWLSKGATVYCVDSNEEWYKAIAKKADEVFGQINNLHATLAGGSDYVDIIKVHAPYDIIVIDGVDRDECCREVLKYLKPKGKLIIDNYLQPSVHVAPDWVREIVEVIPHTVYKHPTHDDWKTFIGTKP